MCDMISSKVTVTKIHHVGCQIPIVVNHIRERELYLCATLLAVKLLQPESDYD